MYLFMGSIFAAFFVNVAWWLRNDFEGDIAT